MSELWIPQPNKHPDIANLFDMMLVFQEKIDSVWDRQSKVHEAHLALRALTASLEHMDVDRRVTVVTDFAILDGVMNAGGDVLEDVGLSGTIEDVHCVQIGETLPMALALGMEAFTIFPAHDPDSTDLAFRNATAPIGSIRYIESIAA